MLYFNCRLLKDNRLSNIYFFIELFCWQWFFLYLCGWAIFLYCMICVSCKCNFMAILYVLIDEKGYALKNCIWGLAHVIVDGFMLWITNSCWFHTVFLESTSGCGHVMYAVIVDIFLLCFPLNKSMTNNPCEMGLGPI